MQRGPVGCAGRRYAVRTAALLRNPRPRPASARNRASLGGLRRAAETGFSGPAVRAANTTLRRRLGRVGRDVAESFRQLAPGLQLLHGAVQVVAQLPGARL